MESLEKRIREDILKRETSRVDRDLKKRLVKKILEDVDFELPESLVEFEIRRAIESVRRNLTRSGSTMAKAGLTEEKLREDFRLPSEKRVREMLILGAIAEKDGLTIDETDLAEGFRELAENMGQDPQAVRSYYEANNLMDSFKEGLLEEKTLNYLVKGAKVTEMEADEMNREKQ